MAIQASDNYKIVRDCLELSINLLSRDENHCRSSFHRRSQVLSGEKRREFGLSFWSVNRSPLKLFISLHTYFPVTVRFMNSPQSDVPSDYNQFSRANCVKKGALFGCAIGMLVGLIWIGIAPPETEGDISQGLVKSWRNFILVGIAVGLVVGTLWPKPQESSNNTDENKPSES